MMILKHVEYNTRDLSGLAMLLNHVMETALKIDGVDFRDIYFPENKNEFVLVMRCDSEDKYLEWRKTCPPPPGMKDWHEVLLTKSEHFFKVNEPNASLLRPAPMERAKTIFQEAFITESIEVKSGKTLSQEEKKIKRFILTQSPVLGRIPSIDEIRKAFSQYPKKKVDAVLAKLDQSDIIHMSNDKSTIAAAYPFSGFETSHIVTLKKEGYTKIYAMCALDALGVSSMFDCGVSIESRCHHCGERIEIEIEDNKIVLMKPDKTVMWCDKDYSCCAATSICKNINFFSSEPHFAEWNKEKPGRKGELMQIQEAFYLGKLCFENRLGK